MGPVHALFTQLPAQLVGVGHWDHLSPTIFKVSVQNLVTRNRGCRGVILAAKGEEKPDHVLRVTVLPLLHINFDSRFDEFLSG